VRLFGRKKPEPPAGENPPAREGPLHRQVDRKSGPGDVVLEKAEEYASLRLDDGKFTGSRKDSPSGAFMVVFRKEKVALVERTDLRFVHRLQKLLLQAADVAEDGTVVLGAQGPGQTGLFRALEKNGTTLIDRPTTGAVNAVVVTRDGTLAFAATGKPDNRIYGFDLRGQREIWQRENPADEEVWGLAAYEDGMCLQLLVGEDAVSTSLGGLLDLEGNIITDEDRPAAE